MCGWPMRPQQSVVELLSVILSKHFLTKQQVQKCIPLYSIVMQQRETIKRLQAEIAELKASKRAKPLPQPVLQPEPQPVSEPESEPGPQPVSEPGPQPGPVPEPQPEPQPGPQPESEPVPEQVMDMLYPMRAEANQRKKRKSRPAAKEHESGVTDSPMDVEKIFLTDNIDFKKNNWLIAKKVVVCQNAEFVDPEEKSQLDQAMIGTDTEYGGSVWSILYYKKYDSFTLAVKDKYILVGASSVKKAKEGWKTVVAEFKNIAMSPFDNEPWDTNELYQLQVEEEGAEKKVLFYDFMTQKKTKPRRRPRPPRVVLDSDVDSEEERSKPNSDVEIELGEDGGADGRDPDRTDNDADDVPIPGDKDNNVAIEVEQDGDAEGGADKMDVSEESDFDFNLYA